MIVAMYKHAVMISLPAPRKKLHVREELASPLPVHVGSPAGTPVNSAALQCYKACYRRGLIIVPDPEHAASLWHNGYFGHNRYVYTENDNRVPQKKCWKLIEASGLKSGPCFKGLQTAKSDDDMEAVTNVEIKPLSDDQENSGIKEVPQNKYVDISISSTATEIMDPENKKGYKTVLVLNTEREGTLTESGPAVPDGYLQLLPEEALFLSYALGCLIVVREEAAVKHSYKCSSSSDVQELTIDHMWSTFIEDDPKFAIKYAVYHYYRTKGWVVKSGLKFGADWVLYPVGPPFYHSQYSIMIQCVWKDTLDRDETLSWRELSWTNISAVERLNNHTNKTPLICFVLRPRSLNREKMKKIECLRELTIQEVMLSRWNPNDNELKDTNT
ncbi:uncharacterized protein Tsen2 isoform X1 [Cherax quadricarinatus]|uniref:uncharacterized protein Tsen2 isoform X1 n=1 Tax=Cherax quadricarinatus TaxID=27406 RepID=UPI00237895BB|nr:uncharacterized protein LOC128699429 isoform X1 [Cherax quadricarinatus]